MKADIRLKLQTLATAEKLKNATRLGWYVDMNKTAVGLEMVELARATRGGEFPRTMPPEPVLGTFFSSDACLLLRVMPNLYWFWALVELALIKESEKQVHSDELIAEDSVRAAMRHLRQAVQGGYNLNKRLDQLSDDDKMLRLAAGLITVEKKDHKAVLHVNPLFCSGQISAYVEP